MNEEMQKLKTITFFTLKINEQGLLFERKEEIFRIAKKQFVKTNNHKTVRLNPSTLNTIHMTIDIVVLEVVIWYKTADELTSEQEDNIKKQMIKQLNNRIASIERNIAKIKSFQK